MCTICLRLGPLFCSAYVLYGPCDWKHPGFHLTGGYFEKFCSAECFKNETRTQLYIYKRIEYNNRYSHIRWYRIGSQKVSHVEFLAFLITQNIDPLTAAEFLLKNEVGSLKAAQYCISQEKWSFLAAKLVLTEILPISLQKGTALKLKLPSSICLNIITFL
jgi:hypothetical protein